MTTSTTPESLADEFEQTARRYLTQAEAEFARGDLLQASEKACGAASQRLKAMAALRGMSHNSHWELRLIARQLVAETGQERIGELFRSGESLHANFYEAWMPEDEVRASIENMKELIDILDRLPPPNSGAPIRPPRTRIFFRDRGDG